MKAVSAAAQLILLATVALSSSMAASYINSNSNSSWSRPPATNRRLETKADKVCTIGKQRFTDLDYVDGYRPYKIGSYLASCDEEDPDNPKLSCYMHDGVADANVPLHEVNCEVVKKEVAKKAQRRRLGVYDENIDEDDPKKRKLGGGLWPKGVVCYTLEKKWKEGSTTELDKEYNDELKAFFDKDIKKNVFDVYEKKSDKSVEFISVDECKKRGDAAKLCNGCKHAVMIAKPKSTACASSVGFNMPQAGAKDVWAAMLHVHIPQGEEAEGMTFQPLVIGSEVPSVGVPPCTDIHHIFHEVGHTLGLLHDHQHPDRVQEVLLNLEVTSLRWDEERKRLGIKLNHAKRNKPETVPAVKKEQKEYEDEYRRMQSNYMILDSMEGTYDSDSIMHYSHDQGVCLPTAAAKLKLADFCDYGKYTGGCPPGMTSDCNMGASAAKWDKIKEPSQGDYNAIISIYFQRR